uniref:D(3) dopamine receptor n=1 Tax=Neogobius melanostomus TaxID=47308 RepID=A0A8C6T5N2_9GOBI
IKMLETIEGHIGTTCGNESVATARPDKDGEMNYYAMFYSLLILAIVFGNVLVCLAVLRERSLQTTTNYLVVSLAVADLLVASLVMPWAVYLEVVGGAWLFSRLYCNIFVTLDVMMCTASILNLCAISIDRYTAVVMPVLYNTTHRSRTRVLVMITTVWVLAFAVSCPLLFGFNTTDNPLVCSISNPDFVIYSSVVSFYLPFIVTLLVYIRIYVFLRMRRKRIAFGQASDVRPRHHIQPSSIEPLALILRNKSKTGPGAGARGRGDEDAEDSSPNDRPTIRMSCEVKDLSNGRTHTSLRPLSHLNLNSSRFRSMHAREKKATQMLAIVLGVFLICWLPFFVTHILNTHCRTCSVPPALYSAFTWLGYVNSALNPVIYTTFNIEFRRAFIKILSC